jgi:transcription initiation factor IIE alpha subunit
MIEVICFCGSAYSFAGDAGACPQCGEQVSFARASNAQPQEIEDRLDHLSTRLADDSRSEELAA